jgi:predicted  nucleic acid-binding Zn ribbon protein
MYIQEISIDVRSVEDKDDLVEAFSSLMSYYRSSGQTLGKVESQYIDKEKLVCLPYTHEKNALDKKFNNFYVNKQIKIIEELFNVELLYKTVGTYLDSYEVPCECKKPEFYILTTNYKTIASPINCGSCGKSVPLYRLPQYYDYGYKPILSWESDYMSCDTLQMGCEVGERWALNQMQKIDSQLSRKGLKICRRIEELTSIPTYYFLFDYRKYKGDRSSKLCPGCKKEWALKTQLHDNYDLKCDECKFLSIISPNT